MRGDPLGVPLAGVYGQIQTYTPTISWGANTISNQQGRFVRQPGGIWLWVFFTDLGTGTGAANISLPAGVLADAFFSWPVGTLGAASVGASVFEMVVSTNTTIAMGSSQPPSASGNYGGAFLVPTYT